jgi:hypothetical protein
MLIPVLIVSAIGLAVARSVKKPAPKGMTAERRKVYEAALCTLKEPAKLRTLADAFEAEDCLAEARLLRQRASLRELPIELKAQRRAVFSRAINSSNVDGILKVASAFAGEGATGAATHLRRHAASLVEQAERMKVEVPPDMPESTEEDEEDIGEDEDLDDSAETDDSNEEVKEETASKAASASPVSSEVPSAPSESTNSPSAPSTPSQ